MKLRPILVFSALATLAAGCATVDRTGTAAREGDWKCVGGTVAGAALGGLAGSTVGAGTGKTVATVGGAAAGGYAGSKLACDEQRH